VYATPPLAPVSKTLAQLEDKKIIRRHSRYNVEEALVCMISIIANRLKISSDNF